MTGCAIRGFLLTQHWRDRSGSCELVFTGSGAQGPFELHFQYQPVFFMRREDRLPDGIKPARRREVALTNFAGAQVDALYFDTQQEAKRAREALRRQGSPTYESDLAPDNRFLMERFIHGGVRIEGDAVSEAGVAIYQDPKIQADDYEPALSTLSLDIETGQRGELYSIGYDFQARDRQAACVYMVAGEQRRLHEELVYCRDEAEVLRRFLEDVQTLDPDLLLGWNIVGFDLRWLEKKCGEHRVPFALGRNRKPPRFFEQFRSQRAEVHGRVVLDGPTVLRASFYRFRSFSLGAVAHEALGEEKDIEGSGLEKVREIERRFREDKEALAHYNLLDCQLVTRIIQKLGIVELLVNRVRISGMLVPYLGRSIGAFDHFYLPRLHRKGFVAPDVADAPEGLHAAGGLVLKPQPGLFEQVAALDFKSLYPTVIHTFGIDPLSRLTAGVDAVNTPVDIRFDRHTHILPAYIAELMLHRREAQARHNRPLSQAIKILMNSFYGVMGTPHCRFYHPDLPSAITGTGQWILRTTKEYLESLGYPVLYGDTDSLFVQLQKAHATPSHQLAAELAQHVNTYLQQKLRADYQVESHLDLEFEKYYRKIFLFVLRGSREGASKRYAGISHSEQGEEKLEFTGMEIVRSDWTRLAHRFQHELFRRFFNGEPLEDWMRGIVADLKRGKFDDQLVYKKRLRKPLAEYTKTSPPHVKAARLLPEKKQQKLRSVSYVMTRRGPVPAELPHADLDYPHYIEKQLEPLADAVLETLGLSFNGLINNQQLELF